MEKILVVIPSFNIIKTRKEECLYNAVDSIVKSYLFLIQKFPEVQVNCVWVDDGSTDGTVEKVTEVINSYKPDITNMFEIHSLGVNKGAAFCRNYAVSLKKADYICFLDADDEMFENHLAVCYDLMHQKNEDGKTAAVGITRAFFDERYNIHESWKNHLCLGFPMTKVIRYDVYNFIEGFPINEFYRLDGGEDFEFIWWVMHFFEPIFSNCETFKYNIYNGSTSWKRLNVYEKSMEDYDKYLEANPAEANKYNSSKNNKHELGKNRCEYLEYKFKEMGYKEKFSDLMVKEFI